ncbi:hypothetical protein [Azospirillum agricola]|uniref:hypothetical protein n=1 Tax=Azospirillum agricola TaxID=1720247 RepID=UPI000A0EEF47|nr:hypothetical protein [Azospirillum agricola]SMH62866.1 hypothetical protein SAMN02982994_6689 [Azospirillum lipoferum]
MCDRIHTATLTEGRPVEVELVQYPPVFDGPAGHALAHVLSDVASRRVHQIERGYDHAHDDAHNAEDMEGHIHAQLHRLSRAETDAAYRDRLLDVAALTVAAIERWDRPAPVMPVSSRLPLEQEVTHWLRRHIGEAMGRTGEAAIAAVTPRMLVGRLLGAIPDMEKLETAIASRWGVVLVISSGNTVAEVAGAIVGASRKGAAS